MKKKLLLLTIMPFVLWLNVSAVNVTVIRSIMATGYNNGADTLWYNYAISMGYNATIDSLSVLNDTSFFATTDVLVVSEGTHAISNTQMQNIITFVKRGKSAYIQSEYLSTFPGDITFQAIMDSVGADFRWVGIVSGQLVPMEILAPFSTTPYQTTSISYYWYGQNGTGCGVDSFLEYDNQYFGFFYHQSNNYGRVITQSDQDWVWGDYDSLLMKNILYHLVVFDSTAPILMNVIPQSPSICSGSSVLLTASGASTYSWSPATGLSATTGDSVVANPTTTTTYTLTGNRSCRGSIAVIITVIPAPPLTIVPSSDSICSGSSIILEANGGDSVYIWSPSTGLNVTTGDSVVANPTATVTYTVTALDTSGCSVSKNIAITVNSLTFLTIQPPSPYFCNGLSDTLTVTGGTTYTWSPENGLNETTGSSVLASPTITVTYTVTSADADGCIGTGSDVVTVLPSPNKPSFVQHNDTLISSSEHDNQWYRNDTLLKNDTSQHLVITVLGYYWVVVNNEANGCSTSSDSMMITQITGVEQLTVNSGQVTVYPNPFSNEIFIKINSSADISNWNLLVTDVLGRTLYSISTQNPLKGAFEIDLSNLSSGVYFITVVNKTGRVVVPVVKQN